MNSLKQKVRQQEGRIKELEDRLDVVERAQAQEPEPQSDAPVSQETEDAGE